MSGTSTKVFIARLSGLAVFDPLGDQVGRVRDVVVVFRAGRLAPLVVGLVVEVPGRRRVFLPMTRVTSLDAGQVISTGVVNLRRFEQRPSETLVLAEVLDRRVSMRDGTGDVVVEDVAMTQQRGRDWVVGKLYVRRAQPTEGRGRVHRLRPRLGTRIRGRGEALLVDHDAVTGLSVDTGRQGAARLLATFTSLKAADIADILHDLPPKRRVEVATGLDDEKLADVLEELPEDDQVQILTQLATDRAADVLEAMQPDDATDLLAELPADKAEQLLQLMEPEEAAPLRRLLSYDDDTAGGLMTSNPVILGPEATVAQALADVRRAELSPALAASVFVCRPPLETPTGRYLGLVHIQRLLREPPHAAVGGFVDTDIEPLPPDADVDQVTRLLATYNLVGAPVVDQDGHLLGAVTVDDLLDHLLPDDWRAGDDDALGLVPPTRRSPALPIRENPASAAESGPAAARSDAAATRTRGGRRGT
ncbi:MAG: magnesium transporter MgtE N-terminal domain-containing protein [Angustibacter sp.]